MLLSSLQCLSQSNLIWLQWHGSCLKWIALGIRWPLGFMNCSLSAIAGSQWTWELPRFLNPDHVKDFQMNIKWILLLAIFTWFLYVDAIPVFQEKHTICQDRRTIKSLKDVCGFLERAPNPAWLDLFCSLTILDFHPYYWHMIFLPSTSILCEPSSWAFSRKAEIFARNE